VSPPSPNSPWPGHGRFRTDEELAAAGRRLTVERVVTKDFRLPRKVWLAIAIAGVILIVAIFVAFVAWRGWSRGSLMLAQALTIPFGFLLISLGFSGRQDVGVPLCGKCRHALPPDATPDRCGECGAWLRSGVQVVRDGRPARTPGLIIAGVAILVLYLGSLSWNMLGLSAALPNGPLIAWAANGEDGAAWDEIGRRAGLNRFSPAELDELAGIAVAQLERSDLPSFRLRGFLETEWVTGRLSPQRQADCLRLAYRLELRRREGRAVLVASTRLGPRPSPAHFARLALDRLTIDGEPGPTLHRVFEHDAIPYATAGKGTLEFDLGEIPADAKEVSITGFVLSSPFARGKAEWDPDTGLLDLEPGTLAAPLVVRDPP
jgi:hypothetical protein